MRVPTIRVLHKESGRIKIINESAFDPELHDVVKESKGGKKAEPKTPEKTDDGNGGGPEPVAIPTVEELNALDDEALKAEAERVFKAKVPHNIGRDTLLERLEELRVKLAAAGKSD